MKRQEISDFVRSVCSSLRLSQAKTLSVLVPPATTLARRSGAGVVVKGGARASALRRRDVYLWTPTIQVSRILLC
jgi:hypothetical protein